MKDTAHFGKSIILLTDTKPEFYKIFTMGLLFPKLILGASTSGDGKFKIDPSSAEDTLSISSLEELKLLNNSLKIRAFSFLLWQKGLANPKLFIFELTNENINIETEQFIRKAKLSSFGFCSILI